MIGGVPIGVIAECAVLGVVVGFAIWFGTKYEDAAGHVDDDTPNAFAWEKNPKPRPSNLDPIVELTRKMKEMEKDTDDD